MTGRYIGNKGNIGYFWYMIGNFGNIGYKENIVGYKGYIGYFWDMDTKKPDT
jgi:hypothetical protein